MTLPTTILDISELEKELKIQKNNNFCIADLDLNVRISVNYIYYMSKTVTDISLYWKSNINILLAGVHSSYNLQKLYYESPKLYKELYDYINDLEKKRIGTNG